MPRKPRTALLARYKNLAGSTESRAEELFGILMSESENMESGIFVGHLNELSGVLAQLRRGRMGLKRRAV